MTQLALIEGPLVRTYQQRGCCAPCWCARCARCGEPLTKHCYSEQEAKSEGLWVLAQPETYHFKHVCQA